MQEFFEGQSPHAPKYFGTRFSNAPAEVFGKAHRSETLAMDEEAARKVFAQGEEVQNDGSVREAQKSEDAGERVLWLDAPLSRAGV